MLPHSMLNLLSTRDGSVVGTSCPYEYEIRSRFRGGSDFRHSDPGEWDWNGSAAPLRHSANLTQAHEPNLFFPSSGSGDPVL
jgi:hypothetical protein